jgi:hypothetical protein
MKRQATQKKIVDQTKNSGVHPDAESQRKHREKSKCGRLSELAQSKS